GRRRLRHSGPTRRSSDLTDIDESPHRAISGLEADSIALSQLGNPHDGKTDQILSDPNRQASEPFPADALHQYMSQIQQFIDPSRSEEHTSELQSRENLVC